MDKNTKTLYIPKMFYIGGGYYIEDEQEQEEEEEESEEEIQIETLHAEKKILMRHLLVPEKKRTFTL